MNICTVALLLAKIATSPTPPAVVSAVELVRNAEWSETQCKSLQEKEAKEAPKKDAEKKK